MRGTLAQLSQGTCIFAMSSRLVMQNVGFCARSRDDRAGQSSGLAASPARTGFRSTYRAAAMRCRSSITTDESRPCHR